MVRGGRWRYDWSVTFVPLRAEALVKHATPQSIAFPRLSDSQFELVASMGTRHTFAPGDFVVQAGQRGYPLWVIETGEVAIVESTSGITREVVRHTERSFIGDVDILTGRPAVISAIATVPTTAIRVDAPLVRPLLCDRPELGEMLLEAIQMRRLLLQQSGFVGSKLIGARYSKKTQALREFFYKNHVPHTFYDIEEPEGQQELSQTGASLEEVPVVVCNGKIVKQPVLSKIAECLGISRHIQEDLFDLLVIGSGPAGLAATVYAASEGLKTLVLDRVGPGGQAGSSSKIENLIGFPSGISGADLANRGYLQALKFGAQFTAPVAVREILRNPDQTFSLELCTGQMARARVVLLATGVSYDSLECPGIRELAGTGVYYAATSVEARACHDTTAIIIGGGNSAGQAAMFLAERARHVKMVIRAENLSKGMSSYLSTRILSHPKIELVPSTELVCVSGERSVEQVTLKDCKTNLETQHDCSALFIFIGGKPNTDWLMTDVARDEKGFLLTGAMVPRSQWSLARQPFDLETSVPGLLAAGDVRSGTTKRCGFAVGDGSLAVTCVHRYLASTT